MKHTDEPKNPFQVLLDEIEIQVLTDIDEEGCGAVMCIYIMEAEFEEAKL